MEERDLREREEAQEERRAPDANCVLLLLGASSLYRGRWDEINPSPKPREEGRRPRRMGAALVRPQILIPFLPMRMSP